MFLILAAGLFAGLCLGDHGRLLSIKMKEPVTTANSEDGDDCLRVDGVYESVETAHDVVAADFNEDGHLDMAVLAHLPLFPERALAVFLGDGQGEFSLFQSLPVGEHNHGVIAVDLNHDGHLDIVATTATVARPQYPTNLVHVFLGDGTGHFPQHKLWPVQQGTSGPVDAQAADLNKDGNLDLIVAGTGSGKVAVLLGDGTGDFGSPRFFSSSRTRTRTTVIADFNGDGNLDVVATNRAGNSLSVLFGDGTGNLSFYRRFRTGLGPRTLIAEDFNGDGNLDLAVACREANAAWVFWGDGRGNFVKAQDIPVGRDPRTIRAGDFNNDGVLDLAVTNPLTQNVSLLFGDGSGTFSAANNIAVGNAPVRHRYIKRRKSGKGNGLVGLDAADVNEDGKMDLLVTSTYDGNVYVLINHCQPGQ
jgi:hypothetical protein